MMTKENVRSGPRLAASPTGALRAAVLVAPPANIADARPLQGEPSAVFARATLQFETLCATLRYFGCGPAVAQAGDGAGPNASAVADCALVFDDGAAILRPSVLSRRPETEPVARELARLGLPIAWRTAPPGLIDGGDVLLVGHTAFVGVGAGSNAFGRAGFAERASAHGFEVVEVSVAGGCALRTVAGAIAHDTVAYAKGRVDAAAFSRLRAIEIDSDEAFGAGVLNIGERHVIADLRYPKAVDALRKARVVVEAIDLYEFGKIGITPSMLAIALRRS